MKEWLSTIVVLGCTILTCAMLGVVGIQPVELSVQRAEQAVKESRKITASAMRDDRMFPMRTKIVLDVVILSPTRQQQIAAAVKAYSIASADSAEALAELKTLKQTKAELAAALSP